MKAAVVGLGWWGRQIVKCLAESEKIRVTHGVDVSIDSARAFGEEQGIALLDDFETALAMPEIEAVILATPHSMHEDQVIAAVKAQKQVFCEKPLALNASSVRRMLDLCEENGLVLGIGHERRYEPAMEHIRRLHEAGEFGADLSFEANFSHDNFKNFQGDNWRLKSKDSPAGAMTALGIHLTDLFISLGGPVQTVWAQTASRAFEAPVQDVVSVLMTFQSGATATMTCLSTTPFYGRFTVFGDQCWAEVREVSNVDIDDPAELIVRKAGGTREVFSYDAENTVLANFEAWADAVAGRSRYRFTPAQQLHNIEILEAITKSAAENRPIEIG